MVFMVEGAGRCSSVRNVEGGLAVDLPADLAPLFFETEGDEVCYEDIASSSRRLPAMIWPAAIALTDIALEVVDKTTRVVELGAGLGAPGMACSRAGASVLLTETQRAVLKGAVAY